MENRARNPLIALTGVTGNMGREVLREVLAIPGVRLRLLVLPEDRRLSMVQRLCTDAGAWVEYVLGDLAQGTVCRQLVQDADTVVNMAAVIPPRSDQRPDLAVACNEAGVYQLCAAIEEQARQPKLIHISTVALYGNRTLEHPWGRVGDPLPVSPFDVYALTKLRGERRVLESGIRTWTVLRQTAMLHPRLLWDNLSDGLLFHTAFNAPLEWVTAKDSGRLITAILRADREDPGEMERVFWNRVFNIGGGPSTRNTGYDVLQDGFSLIGGSVQDFFDPDMNAQRNFHGVWFADSDELEKLFHFRRQSNRDFWAQVLRKQPILRLGKLAPKGLIRKFVIQRLCKDPNSPRYWRAHGDDARLTAYFGSTAAYDALGRDWDKFSILAEDPARCRRAMDPGNARLLDLGFDPHGPVGWEELRSLAELRGGKLLSPSGGLRDVLSWEDTDGQPFQMRGYTVLAGHWPSPGDTSIAWDFDRLSRRDRLLAQVWLDSHRPDEDWRYTMDQAFHARCEKNLCAL